MAESRHPWLSSDHVAHVWSVAAQYGYAPWCDFTSGDEMLSQLLVAAPEDLKAQKTIGQLESLYGGLHAIEEQQRALLTVYPTGFGKSMPLHLLARLLDKVYPRIDGRKTKTILVAPLVA